MCFCFYSSGLSRLWSKKVDYLGQVISAEGVAADPKKVSAILSWPRPHNMKTLGDSWVLQVMTDVSYVIMV